MNEIVEFFKNAHWWQFILGLIGMAIVARIIYEILTDK